MEIIVCAQICYTGKENKLMEELWAKQHLWGGNRPTTFWVETHLQDCGRKIDGKKRQWDGLRQLANERWGHKRCRCWNIEQKETKCWNNSAGKAVSEGNGQPMYLIRILLQGLQKAHGPKCRLSIP